MEAKQCDSKGKNKKKTQGRGLFAAKKIEGTFKLFFWGKWFVRDSYRSPPSQGTYCCAVAGIS